MITADIRAVADAVLYEGYILYPYRKSSLKNQQRWTFGGLFPKRYADRAGGDRWFMQCECLIRGNEATRVGAELRFLQVAARKVAQLRAPARSFDPAEPPPFDTVEQLHIGDRSFLPWDEAVAREWPIAPLGIGELTRARVTIHFGCDAATAYERVTNAVGEIEGLIIRDTEAVNCRAILAADPVAGDIYKVRFRIENHSFICDERCARRDLAVGLSLASTHALLTTENGEFLSSTDPPDDLGAVARNCANEGCWPVMVGAAGSTDTMLAAPIILYDYPKIAPESDSDLFDGTEIDEILILRILTMTEAEKREMASGDARAQRLLARLELLTPAEFGKLHGAWRGVAAKPELVSLATADGLFTVGERVRLRPRKGGDIMDIALTGKIAVVEAIERDFEDRIHVAVVVEDDPGRAFGMERMPGHRFFFAPEEIERVSGEAP